MQPSHPIHAAGDSRIGERLDEVIRRSEVERFDRIAGIRCDEDEDRQLFRRRFFLQGAYDVDSVDVGHLDIKKDDIRPVGADHLDRFSAVPGARKYFDPIQCCQDMAESIARYGLVIRYQSSKCRRGRRGGIRLVGRHTMENTIRRREGRTRTPNGRRHGLNGRPRGSS